MADASPALVPAIAADLYRLAALFRTRGDALAATAGQTQARWQVLSAASGRAATVPQIARRLGVRRQSVQRLADALVADGLAGYADNPDHRGSPHLVPTEAGRAALAAIVEAARRFQGRLAGAIDEARWRRLRDDLRALAAAIEATEA